VPITSVHAGKYGQKTNPKQTLLKLSTTQKKQTTQNTAKQNYPALVASYDTWPGNKVGLFYNAPKPTRGLVSKASECIQNHESTIYIQHPNKRDTTETGRFAN